LIGVYHIFPIWCYNFIIPAQFVSALEKRDGPLTEFNEDDWYSLVEYATVYSREDIRFTFKNGMEIKA